MNKSITLNSGHKIPTIGIGTWEAKPAAIGLTLRHAILNAGYTHIDCAKAYGNEKEVGNALKEIFSSGQVKREDLFITSKLWNTDHHPDMVEEACRQTLHDLQLEYLDLYLIHWGIAFASGEGIAPFDKSGRIKTQAVSIQATWQAMEKLVEKGLVKSIGVANFTNAMMIDLLTYAKIQPAMSQVEIHPYNSQVDLIKYCHQEGVAVTAYSPLGRGGVRSGDLMLLEDPAVEKIAKSHQKTPAQVVLNWAIGRGTVAIPKSVSPARIDENIAIFDFSLTDEEQSQINALNQNHRFVNPTDWGISYFA